jgi:hypothetical protein
MSQNKLPPMQDYAHKMMLLELVRCHSVADYFGLEWLERQIFIFVQRMEELNKRD